MAAIIEFSKTCEMLDLLQRHPAGITASDAAKLLQINIGTVNSRLSKLALYGLISRVPYPGHLYGTKYLYRFLPPVKAPRIAERETERELNLNQQAS